MNTFIFRSLLAVLTLCALNVVALAGGSDGGEASPSDEDVRPTLTVQDIQQAEVIGRLGLPLGTTLTIEGEVFDGQELRMREFAYETMLRVHKVNGEPLEHEVLFKFPPYPDQEPPAFGSGFTFRGYETGSFEGLVPGSSPEVAGTSYHFTTNFVFAHEPPAVSSTEDYGSSYSARENPND